jgi:pyruvate/2-oxoglutarate dehydrogenase complex dihydrolipoamide acyltransferase (E2) component
VAEGEGVLTEILVAEGTTVAVGTVWGVIAGEQGSRGVGEQGGGSTAASSVASPVPSPLSSKPLHVNGQPKTATRETEVGWISPVVARMAAEHGLDLRQIAGSGKDGRITKKDVLAYLEGGAEETAKAATTNEVVSPPETTKVVTTNVPRPSSPVPSPLPLPVGDIQPLTAMRRAIAEHMVHSKRTSPHVTTMFEFDLTAVAAHRTANKAAFERDGVKLTFMPYWVAAVAEALKKHPLANGQWTDEGVLLKKEINIGMAAAIPGGLIVPVIKGADNLNLLGLARTINDLAERARVNRLQADEVRGGTFSITNHGASGSLMGTPIINQPQVGILGIGLIEKRVKVIHDAIAIRTCAYVSFSFDHRILDGATADAFVMDIKKRLEGWL